jgi:hypothetical protein
VLHQQGHLLLHLLMSWQAPAALAVGAKVADAPSTAQVVVQTAPRHPPGGAPNPEIKVAEHRSSGAA